MPRILKGLTFQVSYVVSVSLIDFNLLQKLSISKQYLTVKKISGCSASKDTALTPPAV